MAYQYDEQNIFAKILRGEIPNDTVYEDELTLAFRDINPQRPTHVLVIPKGPYVCFDHFSNEAGDDEIIAFMRAIGKVCDLLEISPSVGNGYRLVANSGNDGMQEVPHLHVHLFGGAPAGPILLS